MWSPIQRVVVEVEAAAPERSEPEVFEPQYIKPDTSSLSLLCQIWIRHARKMRARWARRMCPPARKARYGQGGPLRAGYSAAELRAWAQGRYPRSWFHWNHYKYYISGFFRRVALMRARSFWARGFCGDVCHAPLWPD